MRLMFTMLLIGAGVSPIDWENLISYQDGYTGLYEQLWYSPDGMYAAGTMEI